MSRRRAIVGLCSYLLMSGCASSAKPSPLKGASLERSGYKVSVSVDGKPVQNYDEQLIHRIKFTAAELDRLLVVWPNKTLRSIHATPLADSSGVFMGLKVTAIDLNPNIPSLGLQVGDCVTAIGTSRNLAEDSFETLFDEINDTGEGSITVERNFEPHKVIYFVEHSRGREP